MYLIATAQTTREQVKNQSMAMLNGSSSDSEEQGSPYSRGIINNFLDTLFRPPVTRSLDARCILAEQYHVSVEDG